MGAPCSHGGKGTSAVVAQKTTFNFDSGRTLGQSKTALVEDAIKITAPHNTQALIDMRRNGPALDPGKTTVPGARVTAGQGDPGRQGSSNPRA